MRRAFLIVVNVFHWNIKFIGSNEMTYKYFFVEFYTTSVNYVRTVFIKLRLDLYEIIYSGNIFKVIFNLTQQVE